MDSSELPTPQLHPSSSVDGSAPSFLGSALPSKAPGAHSLLPCPPRRAPEGELLSSQPPKAAPLSQQTPAPEGEAEDSCWVNGVAEDVHPPHPDSRHLFSLSLSPILSLSPPPCHKHKPGTKAPIFLFPHVNKLPASSHASSPPPFLSPLPLFHLSLCPASSQAPLPAVPCSRLSGLPRLNLDGTRKQPASDLVSRQPTLAPDAPSCLRPLRSPDTRLHGSILFAQVGTRLHGTRLQLCLPSIPTCLNPASTTGSPGGLRSVFSRLQLPSLTPSNRSRLSRLRPKTSLASPIGPRLPAALADTSLGLNRAAQPQPPDSEASLHEAISFNLSLGLLRLPADSAASSFAPASSPARKT